MVTFGAMSLHPLKIPNGLLIFKDLRFRGIWINKWYDNATLPERMEAFRPLFEMAKRGLRLKGIRLDSGDLAYLSKKARQMLDAAGHPPSVEQIVEAFLAPLLMLEVLPAVPLIGRVLSTIFSRPGLCAS